MSLRQIDFSRTLYDDQVYDHMMANYSDLGKDWIAHQWNWMNGVYIAFKDHYKYMIVISLIEKTLQFYDQMNIKYTYDQYYTKSYLQIDRFSITELCDKLNLPKETVRRKVLELENLGVLKRQKKQIIIDHSAFNLVKPEIQIKSTSKYIHLVSELFNREKIYSKKLDQKQIENVLKKNFTMCWRWFYRMQIPFAIGYHGMFSDLTTFHIWGTVCMNQAFNFSKSDDDKNIQKYSLDYMSFHKQVIKGKGTFNGVSAMSISDMTNIPRATVIRKCKYLLKKDFLKINEKKQYILTGLNVDRVLPYQQLIFKNKAKFLRKVLNLLIIS